MPNGDDKNWVRNCSAIDGFRARYNHWPSSVRLPPDYFENVVNGSSPHRDAKLAANWVINELAGRLNREGKDIAAAPVSAAQLGTILDLMAQRTISGTKIASLILPEIAGAHG